jgi:hypothetical protein
MVGADSRYLLMIACSQRKHEDYYPSRELQSRIDGLGRMQGALPEAAISQG